MNFLKYLSILILLFLTFNSTLLTRVNAVYDPLSVPNNKYGIHIISPSSEEASHSADLVNTNGDWGYVTLLIESRDRNAQKWQSFFDELRRRHLIPIVRIANHPEGNFWKRPTDGEENQWAEFLNNLNWPTKNRYVIIYNEPNHATEWGNATDPKNYAQVLDKTIDSLKAKSDDFFVLNAGFDASTPHKPPVYFDQYEYMKQMNEEVPGIFNKLDGWASHSYPNPGFVGSPNDTGRKSIRGFEWELAVLKELGVNKILPVFITETGWKHSEGRETDRSLPPVEAVSEYYKQAFDTAWADERIVAVTPFLLNYQTPPFDHFSFKKYTGAPQNTKILGTEYPEFYPQFYTLKNQPKGNGKPVQEYKAELMKGQIYHSLVVDERYEIPLTFKNTGQAIWNDDIDNPVKFMPLSNLPDLEVQVTEIPLTKKVEPREEYTFKVKIKAKKAGIFKGSLQLMYGNNQFQTTPYQFTTQVKSPVILKTKASLKWKDNPESDNYLLKITGLISGTISNLVLGKDGESEEIEARYLIPDTTYDFTLSKPFYHKKTITKEVRSGINELDFGELEPNLPSAILNSKEFWKLLPL